MADINSTAFSQVDSENNTATLPSWAEGQNSSQVNDSARALQSALRRWHDQITASATSTGTEAAQVLTYDVAPGPLSVGQRFAFVSGFTNVAAVTLDVGVGGPIPIFLDGGALVGGEMQLNNVVEVVYDGIQYQLLNSRSNLSLSRLPPGADPTIYTAAPRLVLKTAHTYYVDAATGSNTTGTGDNATPWQSLQYAYDWLVENIDGAGNIVSIYLSGTDSGGLVAETPVPGAFVTEIIINGAIVTGNPWGIAAFKSGTKLEVTGGGSITALSHCIVASEGAYVGFQGVNFGHCGTAHFYAQNQSVILIRASYNVNSGADSHWLCDTSSSITVYPSAGITMVGTPGFTVFAVVHSGGNVVCHLASFGGSATGIRYIVDTGSGIFTNSGGASFLPGGVAGVADALTFGWYD